MKQFFWNIKSFVVGEFSWFFVYVLNLFRVLSWTNIMQRENFNINKSLKRNLSKTSSKSSKMKNWKKKNTKDRIKNNQKKWKFKWLRLFDIKLWQISKMHHRMHTFWDQPLTNFLLLCNVLDERNWTILIKIYHSIGFLHSVKLK